MDDGSALSIAIICLMILMSAFFSATEMAFSSLSRIRIKMLAEGGSKKAAQVLKLSNNYDMLLSTILVGNNIVNIASASMATVVFVKYFGDIGVTLSTIVTTVVVLIFAEISPKSLAKESPESFAMFAAPIIHVIMIVLTPVNLLFAQWKKLLSKLFKSSGARSFTEEELLTIVDEAEQEGAIDPDDKQLINNVIDFNDSRVVDILTPRVDVVGIEIGASKEKMIEAFMGSGYSRIPVYEKTLDNIVGVVHLRDFFNLVVHGDAPIADIMTPVTYTATTTKISDLLKHLQRQKSHIAVIVDEYGGTLGIVTMEDILEELVGEIWDEHDEIVEAIEQLDEHTYRIEGSAALDKMPDLFHIGDEFKSATVGGWVMEQLGKVPQKGDQFAWQNLRVTVTKADHHRALECIIEVGDDQ